MTLPLKEVRPLLRFSGLGSIRSKRIGNNCAHPKEAVNASDVQALKSPRIGIAAANLLQ
jgi:hypothetical protein